MFYYKYNDKYIIVQKSTLPIEGDNVGISKEDFDLGLYDVIIGFLDENNEILRHTKTLRNVDEVARKLNNIEEKINPSINYEMCTLEELKTYQIAKSKENLEVYLKENPIVSSCHGNTEKQYTITKEKQSLLTQMILMCQIAIISETDYQPSWNVQGEPCTYDWTLQELQQLAFEIESVVRLVVNKQQSMEAKINAATSKDDVMAVNITF